MNELDDTTRRFLDVAAADLLAHAEDLANAVDCIEGAFRYGTGKLGMDLDSFAEAAAAYLREVTAGDGVASYAAEKFVEDAVLRRTT